MILYSVFNGYTLSCAVWKCPFKSGYGFDIERDFVSLRRHLLLIRILFVQTEHLIIALIGEERHHKEQQQWQNAQEARQRWTCRIMSLGRI